MVQHMGLQDLLPYEHVQAFLVAQIGAEFECVAHGMPQMMSKWKSKHLQDHTQKSTSHTDGMQCKLIDSCLP